MTATYEGDMTEFDGQIPVLFINLDRRPDRRERMLKQLDALGVRARRLAATDGARMTDAEIAARSPESYSNQVGRPMSRGEIACYDSHVRALGTIVSEGWPWACVLEDDVELDPDFAEWARAPGPLASLPECCDVLKFEAWGGAQGGDGCAVARIADRDVIVYLKPSLGTAGYFISRRGAECFLRHAALADAPFDHVLGMSWRNHAVVLDLVPKLARQIGGDSNIEEDGFRSRRGPHKDWRKTRRRTKRRAASAGYEIIRRECGMGAAIRLWLQRLWRRVRSGRI